MFEQSVAVSPNIMHSSSRLIVAMLLFVCAVQNCWAQSSGRFSGFYGGVEGGAISYNTQITFDGVDDPAGRGGVGYGAFFGYNLDRTDILIGGEAIFTFASDPDPYTFSPSVVGFSELDVLRAASAGLDVRIGYVVVERILVHGNVGVSLNRQSVFVDGTPLKQFEGATDAKTFGAIQPGAGLEVILAQGLGVRFVVRMLNGVDLSASDFGSIPVDASLSRLDVEPSQVQIFSGLTYHF